MSRSSRSNVLLCALLLLPASFMSCGRTGSSVPLPKPTAFGTAIVEAGGEKQIAQTGTLLSQPLIVQVNDDHGNAVPGALVEMQAAAGVNLDPAYGLTDSNGQFTANVTLGGMAGRYQITASTIEKSGTRVAVKTDEIALGYQQTLGSQLNLQYCDRCHNSESTAERVSNYDNLEVKPHPFTDGDMLNKISDADLTAIITYGGAALNKSALMPAWGNTLSKSDIQALLSYIRAVSDPASANAGPVYAKN